MIPKCGSSYPQAAEAKDEDSKNPHARPLERGRFPDPFSRSPGASPRRWRCQRRSPGPGLRWGKIRRRPDDQGLRGFRKWQASENRGPLPDSKSEYPEKGNVGRRGRQARSQDGTDDRHAVRGLGPLAQAGRSRGFFLRPGPRAEGLADHYHPESDVSLQAGSTGPSAAEGDRPAAQGQTTEGYPRGSQGI